MPWSGWLLEGAGGPQLQDRWVLGPHVELGLSLSEQLSISSFAPDLGPVRGLLMPR